MTCSLCGRDGHNKRRCPDRATYVGCEGSFDRREKTKKTSQMPGSSTVEDTTEVQRSSQGKGKGNKGKEKFVHNARRPVRTRKPTIKGYGLHTNLRTGQQTLWSGSKGMVIEEPTQANEQGKGKKMHYNN